MAAEDHCALCGRFVDKTLPAGHPWSAVVDEIIPVSMGGSPIDPDNVQLMHWYCNQLRSNHSMGWARARLAGHPAPVPTSIPFTHSDW